MKKEQWLLIQQKNIMDTAGIQGEMPAPKPLNHEDLMILRAWFFQHCRRPKQTCVKYSSLIYEPGATKLLFFFLKQ